MLHDPDPLLIWLTYQSTSNAFRLPHISQFKIPQLRIDEIELTVCKHKKAVRNKKIKKEQKQARTDKAFMTEKHFQ